MRDNGNSSVRHKPKLLLRASALMRKENVCFIYDNFEIF